MSDRDLIVEVCHNLIGKALVCDVEPMNEAAAEDYRAKESAIRRMLDAAERYRITLSNLRIALDHCYEIVKCENAEPGEAPVALRSVEWELDLALKSINAALGDKP